MFSEWNPKVYMGGDNVIFWGPLAWTVIFGLTFATFLTLVIVPATFSIVYSIKIWLRRFYKDLRNPEVSPLRIFYFCPTFTKLCIELITAERSPLNTLIRK